ncbi:Rrf2 family transcriptional regulator [Bacillus sp. 03113]|uniref:RrF2 family transcriptional regulator n=1 Tax=Bacillus sp. 03113 TaxID=2578211 RepID=UPI001144CB70|nr:Rrf2 family transcriptional regulator [Bacillus sp. 03113]
MSYSIAFSQAIEIILYISIKSEEEQSKYSSIQSISEKLNMPIPSVKRLVGLLKNEGLITSKTGISGGLMLMKKTQDITLFDIFKAIEGSKAMFKFYQGFDVSKFEHAQQVEKQLNQVSDLLNEAEQAMLEVLKKKTVWEIMED